MIADGEDFVVEPVCLLFPDLLSQAAVADEVPGDGQGIHVVTAMDVDAAAATLDGADL